MAGLDDLPAISVTMLEGMANPIPGAAPPAPLPPPLQRPRIPGRTKHAARLAAAHARTQTAVAYLTTPKPRLSYCRRARTDRQPARAPVTANRSTAATCPPVAAAMVITWPGAARKVTLADHGLRVPQAARQQ